MSRRLVAFAAAALAAVALVAVAAPPAAAAGWGKKPAAAAPAPTAAAKAADDRKKLVREGDRWLGQAREAAQQSGSLSAGGAGGPGSLSPAAAPAKRALAAYDRALALAADPDTYYRAFVATGYLDDSLERWRLVIRYFDGVRASDPRDPRETFMLPDLCTALSKLGGAGGAEADAFFTRGVAEYDIFRQRIDDTDPRFAEMLSTYSTNAAELLMALGPDRLDEAIAYYETGIQYGPYEALGYYGAAVAYDRDGQWGKAQELMRQALSRDIVVSSPDAKHGVHTMGRLSDKGVYFVPTGDEEYYFALGYHVQGQRKEALAHYKAFLARLPDSRFAARAREHIAELEAGK